MWADDYHDHFVRPENKKEFDELVAPLQLYNKDDKRWKKMYSIIKKCVKMFGYMNVSLYYDDYMKYGDHIHEFLCGFWVNLREANFSEEEHLILENTTIEFENGFMFIRC
jgi:hypothetical protein